MLSSRDLQELAETADRLILEDEEEQAIKARLESGYPDIEPVAISLGTITELAQTNAKLMFEHGLIRLFDTDSAQDAENPTPPGRVVVEPYTGQGFVGDQKIGQRIYVEQNSSWPQIFARVVAISPHACALEPNLKLGDRVVFERASGNERIRVHTPAGVALFSVVHIFDIYAIVR